MLDEQTIQQFAKMLEYGDAASQNLSTIIIGQLAKYPGLSLWLTVKCYYFHHVLGHHQSFLQVNIAPHLVNNFKHYQSEVQCSAIYCMTQFAKHSIWSYLVQFAISYCPTDVLDASKWPNVFNVLLSLFFPNNYNAIHNKDNDVQHACLHCISQSFENSMISSYVKENHNTFLTTFRQLPHCTSGSWSSGSCNGHARGQ